MICHVEDVRLPKRLRNGVISMDDWSVEEMTEYINYLLDRIDMPMEVNNDKEDAESKGN